MCGKDDRLKPVYSRIQDNELRAQPWLNKVRSEPYNFFATQKIE